MENLEAMLILTHVGVLCRVEKVNLRSSASFVDNSRREWGTVVFWDWEWASKGLDLTLGGVYGHDYGAACPEVPSSLSRLFGAVPGLSCLLSEQRATFWKARTHCIPSVVLGIKCNGSRLKGWRNSYRKSKELVQDRRVGSWFWVVDLECPAFCVSYGFFKVQV